MFAMLFAAALLAVAGPNKPGNKSPPTKFSLTIEIDGVVMAGLTSVTEPGGIQEGGALMNPTARKPGPVNLIFKFSKTFQEFANWYKAAKNHKVERRSISTINHDADGNETSRTNYFNCAPRSYVEKSGHSQLVVHCESSEFKK